MRNSGASVWVSQPLTAAQLCKWDRAGCMRALTLRLRHIYASLTLQRVAAFRRFKVAAIQPGAVELN